MQDVIYHFRFADGSGASIGAEPPVCADPAGLPHWTRLDYHQCPNCPLSCASTPHCPMAVSMIELVATLGALCSYEEVAVRVDTPERAVTKTTTVQRAVGSLMGLLAARSACPHVAFLKPMARFHLPFATEEETICRSASLYLLAQYLRRQQNAEPDWELAGLKAHYQELHSVNAAMAERLRAAAGQDGAVNGLILLDLLAKALPYSIDDALEDVKAAFGAR